MEKDSGFTLFGEEFYGFEYSVRKIEKKRFSIIPSQFREEVKKCYGEEYGDDITEEMWKDICGEIGDDWDIEVSSDEGFEDFIIGKMCWVYKELVIQRDGFHFEKGGKRVIHPYRGKNNE